MWALSGNSVPQTLRATKRLKVTIIAFYLVEAYAKNLSFISSEYILLQAEMSVSILWSTATIYMRFVWGTLSWNVLGVGISTHDPCCTLTRNTYPYSPFYLFIYLFIYWIFKIFFIIIQLQLSAFSPHPSTPPQPNPPPSSTSTLPLDFVLVSFIVAPINPSPHCPLPTPLWLLLHCS